MTITAERSTTAVNPEVIRAFAHLFSSLCSVPSVKKIGLSTRDMELNLWVLMRGPHDRDEEQIFLLEREYHLQAGAIPLEVHVFPLTAVEERNLPPFETLFERA